MIKKFTTAVFLFFPYCLFAQSNYHPGAIVNPKGDTIKGFIDYKEWAQNPKSISFKSQLSQVQPQTLGIADMQYFEVTGFEYYRKYTVSISQNSNNVEQLTTVADTSTKTGTVFLKILQSGKKVSLFSYFDQLKVRYYIADNANPTPQELIYQAYINPANANNIQYRDIFRGQLNNVATSNGIDLSSEVSGLQYEQDQILKVVSEINGVSNTAAKSTGSSGKTGPRLFGGVSLGEAFINYESSQPALGVFSSVSAFSPGLTFGMDFYTNPDVGKIVIRTEISAAYASFNDTKTVQNFNTLNNETVTQHITQITGSISALFIYNFYNTPALKVYAGTGLIFIFATYPTNSYTVVEEGLSSLTQQGQPLETFYITVPIKIGVMLNKKLDINACYLPQSIIVGSAASGEKNSMIQAGVNYFFGK